MSNAKQDARHERDHGGAVPADVARHSASKRRALGFNETADYWDAYADEVESWSEQ